MTIERELLKKALDFMLDAGANLNPLFKEINDNLLAQPEPEPVAWMYEYAVRSSFDASFTGEWKEEISRSKPDGTVEKFNPSKLESTVRNLTPLYTAPPKREPLSRVEIIKLWRRDYDKWSYLEIDYDQFCAVVKKAEKAHGITGGGE